MAEPSSKRAPLLAWIIAALLVAIGVWMYTHWQGTSRPPGGGPPIGQLQSGGDDPEVVQAPYVPGPTPPPAPTGAGPRGTGN